MDRRKFFEKFGIRESIFQGTGLDWNELIDIRNAFEKTRDNLNIDASYVAERLRSFESIHTVKTRIKDPEHLLEKIIRVKSENPDFDINIGNYSYIINDLAGVRALHLFKEDWEAIHQFILNNWELKKEPVANTSAGDSKRLVEKYKENGCEIYEHPYEYRSVHYVILFERSKIEKVPVEIQVRTVLEEAWSEIDHLVRYPYKDGHRIYSPYLSILNQLIAQADEISSLIHLLKSDDNHRLMKSQNTQQVNEKVIADISKQLNKFRIRKDQKKALKNQLKLLEKRISTNRKMQDGLHSADKAKMYTPHLLGTDSDEVSQDKS